jgi:hypothetical protein
VGDSELTCDYLKAEYAANTEAVTRKIEKNNYGDAKDAALGLLIWPGLAELYTILSIHYLFGEMTDERKKLIGIDGFLQ